MKEEQKPVKEMEDIFVGLDIGTTKICAIVGRKNEYGKIDILGMGKTESEGVKRGVVANIQRTVEAIKIAVDIASSKSQVDINVVHVGIAGQHIKSMRHRGLIVRNNAEEEIAQKDIDRLIEDMHRLVMHPGDEIIHVIPQEYMVDGIPTGEEPIGHMGVRLEGNFHIITGQVTAAKNIVRCVTKAGLELKDLVLEPIASSDAVLSEEEKEAGVCLIDIGGGTTDIAIFKEGVIRHTAVIPLGGDIITEDIREGCMVMKKQAEALKVKFGSAIANEMSANEIISIPGLRGRAAKEISVRNLAHIIQARMDEIIEHVNYEIKCSGYANKLIGGIVVTGGGAQLQHLPKLIEYITGQDTRVGYPNEHLAKGMIDEVKSPMYATAIGLVMNAIEDYEREMRIKAGVEPVEVSHVEDKKKKIKGEKKPTKGFLTRIKEWLGDDIEEFKD